MSQVNFVLLRKIFLCTNKTVWKRRLSLEQALQKCIFVILLKHRQTYAICLFYI